MLKISPKNIIYALCFILIQNIPYLSAEETTKSDQQIQLLPIGQTMVVHAKVPAFENQWFVIMLPKTVGEKSMSMINTNTKADWKAHPDGSLTCSYNPGVLLQYEIELVPKQDHVRANLTLQNHTDHTWQNPFFMTLFAPHGAENFKLENGGEIFMPTKSGIVKSRQPIREDVQHDFMMVLLNDKIEETDEPHFLRTLDCTIKEKTTEPWMIGINAEQNRWVSMSAPDSVFHFTNDQISSIHVAPNFGELKPGHSKSLSLIFRCGSGTKEDAIQSARQDVKLLKK